MFTLEEMEAAEAVGAFLQWTCRPPRKCYMCGKELWGRRDTRWDHYSGDDYLVPACLPCAEKAERRWYDG